MEWGEFVLEPLEGGFSGETFAVRGDEDLVVRIYGRHPDRAPIDAALLRLVADLLPVPRVVEVRLATADAPAILITERLSRGQPLDRLLDERDVDWSMLGRSIGRALATLSGIPFLRSGEFLGPDLAVGSGSLPSDLAAWAEERRGSGRLATWSGADWEDLLALIDEAESLLASDGVRRRPALVHSDFNAKNLLVDPETWELTGIVDWEFAHAGSVYADVGNLTRFERAPRFLSAVAEAFAHFAPARPEQAVLAGRAADLWALIELAGRPRENAVSRLAEASLRAQARARDLAAWPFEGSRISVRAARIGYERQLPVS